MNTILNIEIPLNAQVECMDGVCGQSEYVLINPIIDRVTDLVVKENEAPHTEYIVPIDFVTETTADRILLHCSKAEMEMRKPFVKTEYIDKKVPEMILGYGGEIYGAGSYYYTPYVVPETTVKVAHKHLQIPPGELAVQRGTRVEATDGYVGKVDEFVVNPANDRITHLVMREGHLWGKKDVIIPLSAIDEKHTATASDSLFLRINKLEVESLPTFSLHRHWA